MTIELPAAPETRGTRGAHDDRRAAIAWMFLAIALALITLLLRVRGRLGTLRTQQPGAHALRALGGQPIPLIIGAGLYTLRS